jgi:hypothetical protein
MKPDAHLLAQFSSKIINNDAVLIALKVPAMSNP